MRRALVGKLLRHHINAWQLAGFVLANLCGMAIVLAAVQLYGDVKPLFAGNDSFMKPGHIVLTKHVSTVGTLTGTPPAFSQKEINRLKQQPFVNDMAAYTPAMFAVFATVGSQKLGVEFSTEMFFEAVPDEYLDFNSAEFHAHMGYTLAGTFHKCGYKFGRWYDMIWMEKMIGEHR